MQRDDRSADTTKRYILGCQNSFQLADHLSIGKKIRSKEHNMRRDHKQFVFQRITDILQKQESIAVAAPANMSSTLGFTESALMKLVSDVQKWYFNGMTAVSNF